ncbi:response regulator [Paraliobacillus sp. JSM ZJ581]|uniref:response regulator n=1 Tax=Paraliobacillus sp. JSM ZJ581 TaxID=3342118 RepID=UPI0035A87D43
MRTILIDDEHLALEFLAHQLKKFDTITIVGSFTDFNISQSHNLIEETDIVFLDIHMPGVDGLELADKILSINPSISIVFVTAYDTFAVQAFEINALDYILKPVKVERLQKTLDRIIEKKLPKKINQPISSELIIHVSHELTFELKEQTVSLDWRTKKARELFLYLLHHQDHSIHKAELVERFWPTNKTAFSQLYTTVYHIRKCLADYSDYIQIENKDDYYKLLLHNTKVDLLAWEEKMARLLPLNNINYEAVEETMRIYKHGYLQAYNYAWAEAERFRLEQLWLDYALAIANWYKDNDGLQNAVSWFHRIVNIRSDHEIAHFSLLKLYSQLNESNLVEKQYAMLSAICIDMEISINDDIRKWYERWQKSNTAPSS